MKLFLLLMLLSVSAFAQVYSVAIVPGTTNVSDTYNSTNKINTGFRQVYDVLMINLNTGGDLYVSCPGTNTVPSDASTAFMPVPAGGTYSKEGANVGGICYYKSPSGALSSGNTIYLTFFGG